MAEERVGKKREADSPSLCSALSMSERGKSCRESSLSALALAGVWGSAAQQRLS